METTSHTRHTNPIDWAFRSRKTGHITLIQMPNLLLWLVLVAFAVRLVLHPAGTIGMVVSILSSVLLLAWAALEVVSGVNPFRRVLGGVVGLGQIVSLFALK